MENTGNTITKEHQILFQKIKGDILANRGDYVAAGRWVDKYCSVEGYWQRRRDELKELLRIRRLSGYAPHQYTEVIDRIKEFRDRPEKSLFVRSAGIYNHWVEKYDAETFLSECEYQCVLLLTWLLTDPDADKVNTGLCDLAQCPWVTEPYWEGRSYSKDIWLCSMDIEKNLEMVAVAFENVVGAKGAEPDSDPGKTSEIAHIEDRYISFNDARLIVGFKDKSYFTRLANEGIIKDNGVKGQNRKLLLSSVLLYKNRREEEDRLKCVNEFHEEENSIPDMH